MVALLNSLSNPVLISDYISMLTVKLGVDEAVLRGVVTGKPQEPVNSAVNRNYESQLEQLLQSEEGALIHLLVSNSHIIQHWRDKISLEILSEPIFRKLYSLIIDSDVDITSLIDKVEDTLLRDLISLMLIRNSIEDVEMIEHKVNKLKSTVLNRKLNMISRELSLTTDSRHREELLLEMVALRKAQNGER